MTWILEELYTCSKNEMKDKFGLNEAILLTSAVGLVKEKSPRHEYRRLLTRAVLNASYYNDAGNDYKVDIENLINRLSKLKESQAVTVVGMIQEVVSQGKQDEDSEILTEKVKEIFFSFNR